MPGDEPQQQMVRGSSTAGTGELGSIPLVTFMSEQEKVWAARLSEIDTVTKTWRADHLALHEQRDQLQQRALQDRIEAREENDQMRWSGHDRAHAIERDERNKAVDSVDKRLSEMNNLRDQINAERSTFVTRNELNLVADKLEKQIDAVADRMLRMELSISNLQGRIATAGIGLTILMFIIGIGARFLE